MFLIANPVAARTTEALLATVLRTIAASGWSVDWAYTAAPGDARRLADLAVADRVDLVAVLGGDGTTMQAASALVGTGVKLGLLPGGTGNVLAGNLRVPPGPVQAAELLGRARSRRIDLGRVERNGAVHYFGVACSAGVGARIMGETAPLDKRRLGIGGYFQTLFRVIPEVRSREFQLTVDGRRSQLVAAEVLVLNCREIIPPIPVHPEAAPDDGWFEVMALAADSPWQVARGLGRAFANVLLEAGATNYLHYTRGREVTIEAAEEQQAQFDGDLAGTTPLEAIICPGAIEVVAPLA
jgi:diacylglycerol kinase family enzyme